MTVFDAHGRRVAEVYDDADRALVRSAPDLLAALREAVESMSAPFVLPSNMTTAEHFALIVTRARAALAKAEGREA